MTNENIHHDGVDSIAVNLSNTYQDPGIISSPESSAARSGSLFTASASASGTVVLSLLSVNASIRINNAAGSGKTAYISRIICSVGGSSLLSSLSGAATVTRGGTLSSPSTAAPVNNLFGSSQASVMTVQTSSSGISGGTTLVSFQLAPGAMQADYWGGIIVPPGQSLCINTVSSSSSAGLTITSAISVTWWEA